VPVDEDVRICYSGKLASGTADDSSTAAISPQSFHAAWQTARATKAMSLFLGQPGFPAAAASSPGTVRVGIAHEQFDHGHIAFQVGQGGGRNVFAKFLVITSASV